MKTSVLLLVAATIVANVGTAAADDSGFPNWMERQQHRAYRAWRASQSHMVGSGAHARNQRKLCCNGRPTYGVSRQPADISD